MGLGQSKAAMLDHQNIVQLLTSIKTGDLLFCVRPSASRSRNPSIHLRENRELCKWDEVHMLLVRKEGFEDKCFVLSTTPDGISVSLTPLLEFTESCLLCAIRHLSVPDEIRSGFAPKMLEWTSGITARAYQHISMQASDHRCGGVLVVELYCLLGILNPHLSPSNYCILHFVPGPCSQLVVDGRGKKTVEQLQPVNLQYSNSRLDQLITCCHPKLMSQFTGQLVDASAVASLSARPNKVALVGDVGTGKTSILRRVVSNQFEPEYTHSNSADIGLMKVVLGSSMPAAYLQLWDIPSYNDFPDSPSMYYEDIDALVVVVDVGNEESLENVSTWLTKVQHHVSLERISDRVALRTGAQARQAADTSEGLAFPIFIMANKVDLPPEEWEMTLDSVETVSSSLNLDGVFKTSAWGDVGIHKSFKKIQAIIMQRNEEAGAQTEQQATSDHGQQELPDNDGLQLGAGGRRQSKFITEGEHIRPGYDGGGRRAILHDDMDDEDDGNGSEAGRSSSIGAVPKRDRHSKFITSGDHLKEGYDASGRNAMLHDDDTGNFGSC